MTHEELLADALGRLLVALDVVENVPMTGPELIAAAEAAMPEIARRPRSAEIDIDWAADPLIAGPGAYISPQQSVRVTIENADGVMFVVRSDDATFEVSGGGS